VLLNVVTLDKGGGEKREKTSDVLNLYGGGVAPAPEGEKNRVKRKKYGEIIRYILRDEGPGH